jgi:hypothetical protein
MALAELLCINAEPVLDQTGAHRKDNALEEATQGLRVVIREGVEVDIAVVAGVEDELAGEGYLEALVEEGEWRPHHDGEDQVDLLAAVADTHAHPKVMWVVHPCVRNPTENDWGAINNLLHRNILGGGGGQVRGP